MDAESSHGGGSGIQSVTSESEAPQDASEMLLNKSNTLKIRLDPMDFDYFESVVRSDDELGNDQPIWRNVSFFLVSRFLETTSFLYTMCIGTKPM